MKPTLIFSSLFLSFSLLLGLATVQADEPTPTPVTQARELFNGKDFTNWYTFLRGHGKNRDPKGVFSVRDGVIHVSGEEMGCLTTNESFENYRLIVEFRWTGEVHAPKIGCAPDSGILFHSIGEDGSFGGVWMISHEYNLILGASGDFWTVGRKDLKDVFLKSTASTKEKLDGEYFIYDANGPEVTLTGNERVCRLDIARDWKDSTNVKPAVNEKPMGEWNTAELVCDGDSVDCYFNGKFVNHATHVSPKAGKIQLQSEGCGIEFRKITILPLK